ncbi:hypothetical protein [Candidatus Francisella endociliophora]|nr:hypothetical protein [Francisella sp. FSC1006]
MRKNKDKLKKDLKFLAIKASVAFVGIIIVYFLAEPIGHYIANMVVPKHS